MLLGDWCAYSTSSSRFGIGAGATWFRVRGTLHAVETAVGSSMSRAVRLHTKSD